MILSLTIFSTSETFISLILNVVLFKNLLSVNENSGTVCHYLKRIAIKDRKVCVLSDLYRANSVGNADDFGCVYRECLHSFIGGKSCFYAVSGTCGKILNGYLGVIGADRNFYAVLVEDSCVSRCELGKLGLSSVADYRACQRRSFFLAEDT